MNTRKKTTRDITNNLRYCVFCLEVKFITDFTLDTKGPGGRRLRCKSCDCKAVSLRNKLRPHIKSAATGRRRATKLQATPKWADKTEILKIYKESRELTIKSGRKHHVDHIVPLKSKIVCGLHVPANLIPLDWEANLKKGNRTWPDKP